MLPGRVVHEGGRWTVGWTTSALHHTFGTEFTWKNSFVTFVTLIWMDSWHHLIASHEIVELSRKSLDYH